MTTETHEKIRSMMRTQGTWDRAVNFKVYTTEEFIKEFSQDMTQELKSLLIENVKRLQYYCDDRILEPIN